MWWFDQPLNRVRKDEERNEDLKSDENDHFQTRED
jgi:hypothetical protein